jgi:predicted Zn-dependent peptidase
MRPALREDDFNIEKNVIKQEIAMYKDMPGFDVMDQCQTLYFGDHPCGNSILGTEESIDQLTSQQMRDYFSQRYAPNNMTLVVVGNFDWEEISNLAKTKCSSWQSKPVERVTTDTKGTGKIQKETKSNLLHEHICIMSHAVPANSPRRFAAALLATIIGDSFGSRYYWNLIDTAVADNASMQFGPMDGTGVFYSNFSCNPDQTAKLLDIVKEIFQNLLEKGVSEDELQAAKNKTLSELVIQNELPKGRLVSVGSNWIYLNQYRNIQDDIADINSVTTDDIAAFIKDYDLSKYTQFSLGPEK